MLRSTINLANRLAIEVLQTDEPRRINQCITDILQIPITNSTLSIIIITPGKDFSKGSLQKRMMAAALDISIFFIHEELNQNGGVLDHGIGISVSELAIPV